MMEAMARVVRQQVTTVTLIQTALVEVEMFAALIKHAYVHKSGRVSALANWRGLFYPYKFGVGIRAAVMYNKNTYNPVGL